MSSRSDASTGIKMSSPLTSPCGSFAAARLHEPGSCRSALPRTSRRPVGRAGNTSIHQAMPVSQQFDELKVSSGAGHASSVTTTPLSTKPLGFRSAIAWAFNSSHRRSQPPFGLEQVRHVVRALDRLHRRAHTGKPGADDRLTEWLKSRSAH